MADELKLEIPFFQVPNKVFNIGLNPYQTSVYTYLCRCGNNSSAFPSYNDIAKKCGMSRPKAIDTVKELIDKGLVIKHKRDNTSNVYEVRINFAGKCSLPPSKGDLPVVVNEIYHPSKPRLPKKELYKKNYIKNIIDYLNSKTNSSYKANSKKTQQLINARFSEGFKEKDFFTVIDKKTNEWEGTDFQKYLRPETLFGTKFEGYLNQADNTDLKSEESTSNKEFDFSFLKEGESDG